MEIVGSSCDDAPMLQPSPAIVIRADVSIAEAIRVMNKRDVGAVLVSSDRAKNGEEPEIIGIFTERDLLRKVSLIESGKHWERPIRTLMSSPIVTLELRDWEKAAQLLIEKRFRHLPITDHGRLIGVVSVRDILSAQLSLGRGNAGSEAPRERRAPAQAGVIGPGVETTKELRKFLELISRGPIRWNQPVSPKDLAPLDLFLIDIDGMSIDAWMPWLKVAASARGPKACLVIFDPQKHGRKVTEALNVLSRSRRIAVFTRPVQLASFANSLSRR